MVVGAMHIHLGILLFAFDHWFLDHDWFGQACMVSVVDHHLDTCSIVSLVAYLSFFGWFFVNFRIDVPQDIARLSYLYFERSTPSSIESELIGIVETMLNVEPLFL
jgi:hypothetical protein